MLAAGAADRDGDVAAVVAHEARQPALEKRADVVAACAHVGVGLAGTSITGGVAAGQRAQLRIVVRIGQAAHVEHQSASSGMPCL